jgi:hypothetical protein
MRLRKVWSGLGDTSSTITYRILRLKSSSIRVPETDRSIFKAGENEWKMGASF